MGPEARKAVPQQAERYVVQIECYFATPVTETFSFILGPECPFVSPSLSHVWLDPRLTYIPGGALGLLRHQSVHVSF